MTKSIGLIGIGVMGSNIALNFSEKGLIYLSLCREINSFLLKIPAVIFI